MVLQFRCGRPTLYPSEVIEYIDKTLAFAVNENPTQQSFSATREIRAALLALAELTDRIPEYFLIDNAALTDIISSVQAIRTVVREAEGQDVRAQFAVEAPTLRPRVANGWNPVKVLRQALYRCPDDVAALNVDRLPFIQDDRLRSALENDLDGVSRAVTGSEMESSYSLRRFRY